MLAAHGGGLRETVVGREFEHVVYTRGLVHDVATLHIYFEGDGRPWVQRRIVSKDPTSREPLALELMLADPEPAMYVSRPCYQGMGPTPPCGPALWTFGRYAEAVVASMHAVVARLLDRAPRAAVTLIGYSGGGVLALFVAEREPRIDAVVTVGANLDLDAWTSRHGYSPLDGSLNPARVATWRTSLRQIHYVGADDSNVPPAIVQKFVGHVPQADLRVVANYDHRCCWVKGWREILEEVEVVPLPNAVR